MTSDLTPAPPSPSNGHESEPSLSQATQAPAELPLEYHIAAPALLETNFKGTAGSFALSRKVFITGPNKAGKSALALRMHG